MSRLTDWLFCLWGKHAWDRLDEQPLTRDARGRLRFEDGSRFRPGKAYRCLICGKKLWT